MTFSILAVDTTTGASGAAVASCVPLDVLRQVYGVVPGRGALVTQSYLLAGANADALGWLEAGGAPADVLAALLDPAYDPDAALRQYSVLDLDGRAARYTGDEALPFAADRGGELDGIVYAIQGNLLTGDEVLAAAEAAFVDPAHCDLAARLFAALEAGGADGLGDSRCTPHGVPAKSALLRVDPAGAPAGSYLALAVESPGDPPSDDPIARLEGELALFREGHACPEAELPAEGGGGAAGLHDGDGPASEGGCSHAGRAPAWLGVALVAALLAGKLRAAGRRPPRPR